MFSLNKIKQLNLFDQVSELNYLSTKQPIVFLKLLPDNFYLESCIPKSFSNCYYAPLGRNRDYKLSSILFALILLQIFHIPTDVLLHLFLIFSSEIREFCDFYNSVPDDSTYKDRNSMLIYDTSGLKPKVKENNPNTLVSEINKQKSYAKATNKEDYNAYAATYKNMPKFSEANPNINLVF